MGEPGLQQRAGRGENEIRQADREREHDEDLPGRVAVRRRLPDRAWQDARQQDQQWRPTIKRDVQDRLLPSRAASVLLKWAYA